MLVSTPEDARGLMVKTDGYPDWYYPGSAVSKLCALNVHLRGGLGYYDELTGALGTDYRSRKIGGVSSPAIDASTRRTTKEPMPNGKYVNLGCYGDTPWATMSPNGGCFLIIR